MSSISRLKVLYIEDNQFSREEMRHFLKKRVQKVFTASDGAEGLSAFALYKPDIVIADLLMPNMDGLEMMRRIKAMQESVHFIVATSVNKVETVIETVDLGVEGYIVKPIDFAELELKLMKIGDAVAARAKSCPGVFDKIENKRAAEDNIKRELVKEMKDFTGKGPRETVVQLLGSSVKVTNFGAVTKLEESLLADAKNFEMIKHMRTVAYESMAGAFIAIVEKHTGVKASLEGISIDLKKGVEQVVLAG